MESIFEYQNLGFSGFDSFMPNVMDPCWKSLNGVEESAILESEKTEHLKAKAKKKGKTEMKNSAALKSHCEAERRRRERINGHLATLRNFLPCSDNVKMDKATLLAKVISQVKMLRHQATEASKGLVVPTDGDEVTVEPYYDNYTNIPHNCLAFKASICSDYKPELILNIRKAIKDLKLTITKAEISTLEGRVKNVVIVTGCKEDIGVENSEKFAKSLQDTLCCVLERISAAEEYLPSIMYSTKRRKVSYFESSTSSSSS